MALGMYFVSWVFIMSDSIGTKILELRKAKGISQAELAKRIGVSQQAIARYEQNKVNPRFKDVMSIARALDINPVSMFDGNVDNAIEATFDMLDDEFETTMSEDLRRIKNGSELLDLYSRLNLQGKISALEHLRELVQIPGYIKKENTPTD